MVTSVTWKPVENKTIIICHHYGVVWQRSKFAFWSNFCFENSHPIAKNLHRATLRWLVICCSRKYPYPCHRRFFGLYPHPSGNSSLHVASHFPLKMLGFETPLHLGISNDLLWGGYGYFITLIISVPKFTVMMEIWRLKCHVEWL